MGRSERHEVARIDELATDGARVITEIDGNEIAVFRLDDEYHAVLNYCVHQSGPLCQGQLTGYMIGGTDGWSWDYHDDAHAITCPWHGWKFDIRTGRNIKDTRYSVPTYDIEIEDGIIYVLA